MVDYDRFLIYFQGTIVDLTDTDTAYELVVVDGADKDLGLSLRITFRLRDIVDNGLE